MPMIQNHRIVQSHEFLIKEIMKTMINDDNITRRLVSQALSIQSSVFMLLNNVS